MHHERRKDALMRIERGFLLVHCKASVHKSHNFPILLRHDQSGTLEEWGRNRQQFKDITGKTLGCISAQLTGMPEVMKPWRIRVMERPVEHSRSSASKG